MIDIHLRRIDNDYLIKYDCLRKKNKWTAIGPSGRLGDVATEIQAYKLIEKDKVSRLNLDILNKSDNYEQFES